MIATELRERKNKALILKSGAKGPRYTPKAGGVIASGLQLSEGRKDRPILLVTNGCMALREDKGLEEVSNGENLL